MKRIIFIMLIMTGFLSYMMAQSDANVSLCVYMPKSSEIPEAALQFLESQLENIATENGTADMVICDRFILTAKVDVLQKDIVAGPPQRISQTLNITLQVGDAVDNKLFSSTSLTAVGIGTNLTKAYMEAFKQIRKNNKQIADFLEQAKGKIVQYYQEHCESIYAEAQGLAKLQQYDEALYRLACVPDIGTDCYTRCQNAMVQIWQTKINSDGRQLLKFARTAWAQSQDEVGAEEAANYLRQISPAADCQGEVSKLISNITAKIKHDEERAWQFQLRQYNDRVQQEREASRNKQELLRMGIQAAKDVAIAFAQNQPKREYIIW
ncbi:MAG: hypothetical protein J6T86_09695 [Bacteroidales bacterium]|nr:hypothetical protein [Bacteroidales bacterium]